MKFLLKSVGVVAIVAAAASCGGGGGDAIVGTGGPPPPACSSGTFCMGGAQFIPTSATVARNSAVVWSNTSTVTHNVTFDNPPATVGDISTIVAGATASRTFSVAGVYPFHCNIHSGMTGTLTVQ